MNNFSAAASQPIVRRNPGIPKHMGDRISVEMSNDGKWFVFSFPLGSDLPKYLRTCKIMPIMWQKECQSWAVWCKVMKAEYLRHIEKMGNSVTLSREAEFAIKSIEVQNISFNFSKRKINGVHADLFDHQCSAVDALERITSNGRGGILCDGPGLGKTLSAISYIIKNEKEALIVCPKQAVGVWDRHLNDFTDIDYSIISTESNKKDLRKICDFRVINYSLLNNRLGWIKYLTNRNTCLVLDEIHEVRNKRTKTYKTIKKVKNKSKYCIGLTATPIWNDYKDLIGILDLIDHNWFGGRAEFNSKYSESRIGLKNLLKCCMVRRIREQIDIPVPEKVWKTINVELDNQKEYNYIENNFEKLYSGKSKEIVYLNKLRKISSIGKLSSVIEVAKEYINKNEPVIFFSCFLDVLKEANKALGKNSMLYTGKETLREKALAENRFNSGRLPIFLASIECAKQSLSLVGGSTVIFIDLPWSPMTALQAAARPDRIKGQESEKIEIVNIVGSTIDDKMNSVLIPKIKDFKEVTGDVKQEVMDKMLERVR